MEKHNLKDYQLKLIKLKQIFDLDENEYNIYNIEIIIDSR